MPIAKDGAADVDLREKIRLLGQWDCGRRAFRLHDHLMSSQLIMLTKAAGGRQGLIYHCEN